MIGRLALLLLLAVPSAAHAAEAIETDGSGELTMCRSWIVFNECNSYHHIAIPDRIETGDKIKLIYGSNTKIYYFPIDHIAVAGDHCTLFDEPGDAADGVNKIEVGPCRPAAK